MTIPVIKSFAFGVILDSGKIPSYNDSEALMTAEKLHHGLNHDKASHLNIRGFTALGTYR